MKTNHEFYENGAGCVIVTNEDDLEIDYGRIRTFETESGFKFVTDITNYGDMVETFRLESMAMGKFDGEANFELLIIVGDTVTSNIRIWPTDNADVDRLCRLLTVETGEVVTVEAKSRILAIYDRSEQKEKAHGLDHFYLDVDPADIEATTWPRSEMTYDEAVKVLAAATRDELRDHAFGDREIYWTNDYGQSVATGYVGSGGCEIDFTGFELTLEEDQYRDLINLGKVGNVERNDSTGPDEFEDGKCMPGLTLDGVRKELEGE
ncbi:hypothetical protein D3C87_364630 [compost metagenome]